MNAARSREARRTEGPSTRPPPLSTPAGEAQGWSRSPFPAQVLTSHVTSGGGSAHHARSRPSGCWASLFLTNGSGGDGCRRSPARVRTDQGSRAVQQQRAPCVRRDRDDPVGEAARRGATSRARAEVRREPAPHPERRGTAGPDTSPSAQVGTTRAPLRRLLGRARRGRTPYKGRNARQALPAGRRLPPHHGPQGSPPVRQAQQGRGSARPSHTPLCAPSNSRRVREAHAGRTPLRGSYSGAAAAPGRLGRTPAPCVLAPAPPSKHRPPPLPAASARARLPHRPLSR